MKCFLAIFLFSVPASNLLADWSPAPGHLQTRWAKEVTPTNCLQEYPRPQMMRKDWQNLNGLWDFALSDSETSSPVDQFTGQILVPFPYESSLSGIGKPSPTTQKLWYRRSFDLPGTWNGQRILLHFGAVNWSSEVWINGKEIGAHKGGYDGFDFDVTDAVQSGTNSIVVSAFNPLLHDVPNGQALGKQRPNPGGVLYTGASGIWQTVWLEPVPASHIDHLKITPDVDNSSLQVEVDPATAGNSQLQVVITDGGQRVAAQTGPADNPLVLKIPSPHLWSPTDPHLYDLTIALVNNGQKIDAVTSYAALRKISLGKDDQGRTCIFLNNQALYEVGCLDQGYWPDGIYTAPTDDALRYDIELAKKFNFNLIRKHAKAEPDRWYYWTDHLGMLVWQDMPQMFGIGKDFTNETKQQWMTEWTQLIHEFYNHPSIIVWTCFNEDWGQHDTEAIAAATKSLDPTRLVNAASGGYNLYHNGVRSQWREDTPPGIGDIQDEHAYPDPPRAKPDESRASVTGEFGGITMAVPGHDWTEAVFGYGSTLHGSYLLTKRYQDLMKEAWKLKDEVGQSGCVYTQIVDVEQEINGLVTYDREVIKPDQAVVEAANRGEFPELPPNPNVVLSPASNTTPQTWKYTTDMPGDDWTSASFDDGQWESGTAPFGAGYPTLGTSWHSGDIWLRRSFSLGNDFPKALSLLVKDDDSADVYINGVEAAKIPDVHGDYFMNPIKPEAIAALKSGDNILAVHAHQTVGGQIIDVGITEDDK